MWIDVGWTSEFTLSHREGLALEAQVDGKATRARHMFTCIAVYWLLAWII